MVKFLTWANTPKGRRIHRWLSIVVALYVIMATASGIIHIVMANFFAPPPPVVPQGLVKLDEASLPLSTIVKKIPKGSDVKAINIRTIEDTLWYQIITNDKPLYIHAATGKINPALDARYARQIALDYLRREKGVAETGYLTGFDSEYLNIFRVLPVYRFDTNSGRKERVYVSTVTGSATLYLNTARSLGQKSFSYLHKLAFIPNHLIRDILQTLLVLGIVATTLMGIGIFMGRKPPKHKK